MDAYPETAANTQSIVELVPVLIAITNGSLRVLTVAQGALLPNGLLAPLRHSLQAGVRMWVAKQTSQPMGYVEQLYTFVDTRRQNEQGLPVLYVSYLGLVREAADSILHPDAKWQDCYSYFPWEDLRTDGGQRDAIVSRLRIWANSADTEEVRQKRLKRIHLCWGVEPENWSEEYVLQRYEMLYESGLIAEAAEPQANFDFSLTGQPMRHDHRRVLATALSRLRAKIKYRPVIFELMPPEFTLLQLQNSVEAISGRLLHKQNFRRQIQQQNLIEPSDTGVSGSKGRPAQLYRFRDDVLPDRLISDIGLPLGSR
ncbi:NUDIX hydrolase [Neisseria sp.]